VSQKVEFVQVEVRDDVFQLAEEKVDGEEPLRFIGEVGGAGNAYLVVEDNGAHDGEVRECGHVIVRQPRPSMKYNQGPV